MNDTDINTTIKYNTTLREKLLWNEDYSVGVKEIDDQHKQLFGIVNSLIEIINSIPKQDAISEVLKRLEDYKACHFCTEENYFEKFQFTGAKEHIHAHKCFTIEIMKIQFQNKDNPINLSFELVDYLEDWLVNHLMYMDQKYVSCFKEHGLT